VDLLKKLLDRFGSRLNYVIVLNQLRGENFDLFEKSGEREHAQSLHARIISLRRLHEPVINKIDAGSTSFWAAKNKSTPKDALAAALSTDEKDGDGRALRSSFPLVVSGRDSISTKAAGTM
jgi:hypothetical protein